MHCIDDHPLKKYRLTSVYKDDMDWIRGEIIDIKMCIREVACRIEKLLERHEELSWTLARIIGRSADYILLLHDISCVLHQT
jgi:hypothetical protein